MSGVAASEVYADMIELSARQTCHEFLLENLWASLFMQSVNPLAQAQEWQSQLEKLSRTGYVSDPKGAPDEQLHAIMSRSIEISDSFAEKVVSRVESQLKMDGRL